jgi:hypothetical protein
MTKRARYCKDPDNGIPGNRTQATGPENSTGKRLGGLGMDADRTTGAICLQGR